MLVYVGVSSHQSKRARKLDSGAGGFDLGLSGMVRAASDVGSS